MGAHGPGWGGYPTADAPSLGKPLWDSEGHFDEKLPFNQMARNINRNYAAGKVTAAIYWPVVSAIYGNLPYDNIGLINPDFHFEWLLITSCSLSTPPSRSSSRDRGSPPTVA